MNCNTIEKLPKLGFKGINNLILNGGIINISKFEKQLQQQQQQIMQFQDNNKDFDQSEQLTFEELFEQENQLQLDEINQVIIQIC